MNYKQLKDRFNKIKCDDINRTMFDMLLEEAVHNPYGIIYSIMSTLNDACFYLEKMGLSNDFKKEIESKRIKKLWNVK